MIVVVSMIIMERYLGDLCKLLTSSIKVNIKFSNTEQNLNNYLMVDTIITTLVKILEQEDLKKTANGVVYRWLLSQKLIDDSNFDPIIPLSKANNLGLKYYLQSKDIELTKITSIEKAFHENIEILSKKVYSKDIVTNNSISIIYLNNCYKIIINANREFLLTEYRYNKLKKQYININNTDKNFKLKLVQLLMRYIPITELCSGYSGGIPRKVFDYIQKNIKTNWELFASPLNYTLDNYLSPYEDTDIPFGSSGNFFNKFKDIVYKGGSFEVNPPFTEEYLSIVTSYILEALNIVYNVPLTFVYIHPYWTDLYGYKELQMSKFLIKELNFERKDHYYEAGLKYNPREDRLVLSSAKSTIFILQNDKAKIDNNITDIILNNIKILFINPNNDIS